MSEAAKLEQKNVERISDSLGQEPRSVALAQTQQHHQPPEHPAADPQRGGQQPHLAERQ